MVTHHDIFINRRLRIWTEQLFYHSVVTLGRFRFDLCPARPKTGTTQKVTHQGDVFLVSHRRLLTA